MATGTCPACPARWIAPGRGALLDQLGLVDRNGDGARDDAGGRTARIAILSQKGHTVRERTAAMIQEQLRQVGLSGPRRD